MKDVHSYWAYLVLAALIVAVVNALLGLKSKKEFTAKDLRLGLFALIFSHIQLLIGLAWYFMSDWYKAMKITGFGTVMKNAQSRLILVEHPTVMILGIALITIGWSKHKKQTTAVGKFKTFAVFYGLALVLILSRIPWNQWF